MCVKSTKSDAEAAGVVERRRWKVFPGRELDTLVGAYYCFTLTYIGYVAYGFHSPSLYLGLGPVLMALGLCLIVCFIANSGSRRRSDAFHSDSEGLGAADIWWRSVFDARWSRLIQVICGLLASGFLCFWFVLLGYRWWDGLIAAVTVLGTLVIGGCFVVARVQLHVSENDGSADVSDISGGVAHPLLVGDGKELHRERCQGETYERLSDDAPGGRYAA